MESRLGGAVSDRHTCLVLPKKDLEWHRRDNFLSFGVVIISRRGGRDLEYWGGVRNWVQSVVNCRDAVDNLCWNVVIRDRRVDKSRSD